MDGHNPRPRHIVIIGGGVIGITTAYYLTRHPSFNSSIHHITVLEASSLAAGASGKAGGLLGLWAYPMCIVPLSYRLHAELAAEHGGAERWGYRRLACGQLAATVRKSDLKPKLNGSTPSKLNQVKRRDSCISTSPIPPPITPLQQRNGHNGQGATPQQSPSNGGTPTRVTPVPAPVLPHEYVRQHSRPKTWEKLPKQDDAAVALLHDSILPSDLNWINSELVGEYAEMGLPGYTETAQVHPFQFTTAMAELARSGGTDIRIGTHVTNIGLNSSATGVKNVEYLDRATNESSMIHGVTDVVVAAGPWTGNIIPRTKVQGLRAHSVVFEADVSPYAVFTNISLPNDYVPPHRAARGEKKRHKGNVDPEIYARPGNEVYACGEPDHEIPLPEFADQVQVDETQCDDMVAYISTVSKVLGESKVTAKQACYMPRHMRPGQESTPMMGGTSVDGLWVAAGHTCWGIQNGPATGKLMSEYIFDGEAKSAEVGDLDPRNFKI
ncbi:FAD dependent oxidoreductase [Xylariaceae sp. FL0016]|nr:FAD dependent oxidoreductase [Xylariaceae sp. FL0016]